MQIPSGSKGAFCRFEPISSVRLRIWVSFLCTKPLFLRLACDRASIISAVARCPIFQGYIKVDGVSSVFCFIWGWEEPAWGLPFQFHGVFYVMISMKGP